MGRAAEIKAMMGQKKNAEYPDLTPAVSIALAKAQSECAESAASIAAQMGGDEETLTSMCVKNYAMVTPVLNSSYYIRKEVCAWDAKF